MSNSNTLFAKDRIESLVDEKSFVELGAGITKRSTDFNMEEKSVPADGVITGYGLIQNNPVYVYSQDASALNGTIGEMHAKKIAHIYELAMKTGVPVIGLIDCAGMRLQESTDALAGFGQIYKMKRKGFRRDPTDQRYLWQLRRRCCCYGCHERFYIYGAE